YTKLRIRNQNDNVQNIDAHVVQDERVNVVADKEVVVAIADEVIVSDKPKGTRKKRKYPKGIAENVGLGELAHTKLTVELADMTVKYPKGIAENVLVGIGKFVFPVDFIILDMP
ncbi:hypothetical protein Tco_0463981, partial [Tanacetum coccineum]